MEGLHDISKRAYQGFHDWRVRLYNDLGRMDTDYLQALRGDLQHTVAQIEQELTTRSPAASNDSNDDRR